MTEPLSTLRPRYDELSRQVGLYKDPEATALRESPLQQLWREHLLSRTMIANGVYSTGRFVVIYPKQNVHCASAVQIYQNQLLSDVPNTSGFQAITLDDCIDALRVNGDQEIAIALHKRYLDFERVERMIFD